MPHIVRILEAIYINHDVKRFKTERPKGYDFIPGQATDVSINLPGWEENLHPFTFTGLMEWDHLEFTIKIYDNPNGVTHKLGQLNAGSELIIHDVFGTIEYKGPGVFIAGGAGVTPFIAIIRYLFNMEKLQGNRLICSNKTSADVILEKEFRYMLGDDFISVLTREGSIGYKESNRINRDFLTEKISNFSQYFYVCGPDEFVKDINKHLQDLGAKTDLLVFEK